MLRETFKPEGNDVTGEWRRIPSEVIHYTHRDGMDSACSTSGGDAYKVLMWIPEGKRQT
jgi:hypothetical protein